MKPVLSIILPTIRPQNLNAWYKSVREACKENLFEVISIGPYNLPKELENIGRITHISSYANPTICIQIAMVFSKGYFSLISADDLIYFPGSIDNMIKFWNDNNLKENDLINPRYRENAISVETLLPLDNLPPELPMEYWTVNYHDAFKSLSGIDKKLDLSLQPLFLTRTFYKLGGLDVKNYENSVFPILEYVFKNQYLGGKVYHSSNEVSWASHTPHTTFDHSPVHFSMGNDERIFRNKFSNDIIKDILYLNYFEYKNQPEIWERRFGKLKRYGE